MLSSRSLALKVAGILLLMVPVVVIPVEQMIDLSSGFFEGGEGASPFLWLILLLVPTSLLAFLEWHVPIGGGVAVAVLGLLIGIFFWRLFTAWGTFDADTGGSSGELAVLLALGAAPTISGLLCIAAGLSDRRAQEPASLPG
jgi:hypothetical protein